MPQNIFDNEEFFNGYKQLRENRYNYNELVEQPAIKSLLPHLKNKKILDLGCGYGDNCKEFINNGAQKAVGIDISEKMLKEAKEKNQHHGIDYYNMDMQDINKLSEKFDIIFSSLAFHYIEDFGSLLKKINNLLNNDGILLFSQEHPIITAPKGGPIWTKNSDGVKIHFNLSDYLKNGKRNTKWFVEGIEKYHRSISELVNGLIAEGFQIENITEPVPNTFAIEKRPDFYDELEKPTCIIIKARKV